MHAVLNVSSHWSPVLRFPFVSSTRLAYLMLCILFGLSMGWTYSPTGWIGLGIGGLSGFSLACCAFWVESRLTTCSRSLLFGGSLGLICGLAGTSVLMMIWQLPLPGLPSFVPWGLVPSILLFPYLGLTIGLYFGRTTWGEPSTELKENPALPLPESTSPSIPKLLDSSAIIDGRVLHLCATGFLEGPLLIPEFILQEINLLADSDNPEKRTKGKRGLSILSELQQLSTPKTVVIDNQGSGDSIGEQQLIDIAKFRKGKIVTNDWNLAKVADLQEVKSLNVNELTYHLRPLVLPGEQIRVFLQKEGQGFDQGIAHLDDGTMVVIDHGASLVGKTIDVEVTRFMQTNTGRMIFAFPLLPNHSVPSLPSSFQKDQIPSPLAS